MKLLDSHLAVLWPQTAITQLLQTRLLYNSLYNFPSLKTWQNWLKKFLHHLANYIFSEEPCTSTGHFLKGLQTERAGKFLFRVLDSAEGRASPYPMLVIFSMAETQVDLTFLFWTYHNSIISISVMFCKDVIEIESHYTISLFEICAHVTS